MPTGAGFLGMSTTFEPDLIDLDLYEGALRVRKARGMSLMPPPPTPGLIGQSWTLAELDTMRRNRLDAEEIYQRIKAETA